MQCRQCGLCCHKKCIVKCQMSTGCNAPIGATSNGGNKQDSIPDVILQPDEAVDDFAEEVQGSNLKRVNSVNNLTIPGKKKCCFMMKKLKILNLGSQYVSNSSSRSLPPSPQRTPSRKQSLVVVNPFTMCPSVLEEVQKRPDEAGESVNKLLEQIMLCTADEELMDAAKETGQQFYTSIPHEEKVEKINLMVTIEMKTGESF